jgi:hypothetical protein
MLPHVNWLKNYGHFGETYCHIIFRVKEFNALFWDTLHHSSKYNIQEDLKL